MALTLRFLDEEEEPVDTVAVPMVFNGSERIDCLGQHNHHLPQPQAQRLALR
jgi:hypothetical protein